MFVEDHSAYLIDFGVDAVVAGRIVRGIFDNAYADPLGIVAGSQPVLLVISSVVPDVAVGDSVTVGGDPYTVGRVEPDGAGLTRLVLK